jgi:hypothetical protein
LLVLTGVSDAEAVLAAPSQYRPTYLGADLNALHSDVERVRPVLRAPWQVRVEDDALTIAEDPASGAEPEPVGALRALCEMHWGRGGGPVRVRALDETSRRMMAALRLTVDPVDAVEPEGDPVG